MNALFAFLPLDLLSLFPEIFLAAGILLALVAGSFPTARGRLIDFALGILLGTLVLSLFPPFPASANGVSFVPDNLARLIRLFAVSGAILTLWAQRGSPTRGDLPEQGERSILILGVTLGAMLFASASDLLGLYLGLEFLSLSSYGLCGFRSRDPRASEAGLKYVLYGGVASAIALFGASHLFGATGTLRLEEIGYRLAQGGRDPALLVPVLLLGVAFAWKLALVPFHLWSPDIYQGCPTLSVGFLSTVPKGAAVAALVHAYGKLFPRWSLWANDPFLPHLLLMVGSLTVLVGAVTALRQRDAKRLLAFSSIANAGILLLPLAGGPSAGIVAIQVFYLAAYLAANLGAFMALDRLVGDGSSAIEGLSGSWKRQPGVVVSLVLCLVSLAGIPPLAGFAAKWMVLADLVRMGTSSPLGAAPLLAAALVLVASVVLGAAYLRLLRVSVLDSEGSDAAVDLASRGFLPDLPLALSVLAVLGLGWGWPLVTILRSVLQA